MAGAGALVKLLILTGARRNEITELSRDEIKAEAIELPGERTKNGFPHTMPLTPMMCRVLEEIPRAGKFVLNGEDRPFGDHSGAKEKITPAIRSWRFMICAAVLPAGYSGLAWRHILLS
jgi:integrase